VVTRWYRAPEILVWEDQYDGASDIWSCAMIFGWLLNEQRKITIRKYDNKPNDPYPR